MLGCKILKGECNVGDSEGRNDIVKWAVMSGKISRNSEGGNIVKKGCHGELVEP